MSNERQNISKEDEERLSKLFNSIDRNKDGRIDIGDLSALLKSRNVPNASDQAQQLMKHDADNDGKMSFDEFLQYVTEHEKKLKLYFKKLDTNQDGVIDASEIKESFKNMGVTISSAEAQNLLKRMDTDGTLAVDYGEWRDFLLLSPSNNLRDILHYWRHSTIIDIGDNTIVPDDFTENEMQTGMWWRHLVAGGAAGAVSRTCTAPLDRLKILFQVHGSKIEKKNKLTIMDGFKHMLKEGGVKSLWRGNGINVIKIAPESAIKFMAYEQFKQFFKRENHDLGAIERFCAGSAAGAFSQTCIYPMEVLKTRLAIRKTGQYKGMVDCAIKLFKNEGPGTFFRGYVPNIIGIIPYAGTDLCIYETLKTLYMSKNKDQDPGVLVLLACGTTSSTCGQLFSYPLALVRTKLQAEPSSKGNTMSSMFKRIYSEEGFKGFYRGLAPNFLKVAPAVSISYVVYEHVRQYLGIKMS
ncbi:hypothetical protein ACF0H5_022171 [Mactra antiquata]